MNPIARGIRSSLEDVVMAKRTPLISIVSVVCLIVAACAGPAGSPTPAPYPSGNIGIMAPADPGGGWDSTARAMQTALTTDVVDVGVDVYNVGGAAGTIGLAQFVEQHKGNPQQLMVMGLVMVGGILTNDSQVTLDQVTPIASLTTEWEAIAVAADSPYENLQQLVDAFKADPTSVAWGGGSAGGTDHMVVALIAKAAGVDPEQINYIAHAGGGELTPAILSGNVAAGVSGLSEFADQVEAGDMRLLAVTSDARLDGVEAPTVSEAAALDVVISNWRGVVAPPEISDAQRDAIVGVIQEMHDGANWQAALESNGWADLFQTGDDFETFLASEQERVEQVLTDIGLI
jgi:putative tricarboxylic transport membrane protein